MKRVVIIHGTMSSPESNWFPWLKQELSKSGYEALVPRMPTPEGQTLTNWLETFEREVGAVDSSTTIIGHSVGATFLLRLLERRQKAPIGASAFVAGFTRPLDIPEIDPLIDSFVDGPYNWETIRENAGRVVCVSGEDDPYVPLAQGLELAEMLRVKPVLIPKGGHLNAESGYTTFPRLLELM